MTSDLPAHCCADAHFAVAGFGLPIPLGGIRRTVHLCKSTGYSLKEAAGALGLSVSALKARLPEYAMELAQMASYLFFTCVFATLFQHPDSPICHLVPNDTVRRACFGTFVGATIVAIVLTPWGKQSGGHLNPAMTFTFYRLGKMEFWDAIFYGVVQFAGATASVVITTFLLLGAPGNPAIRYAATLPGIYGSGVAFIAEVAISFTLIFTVLIASNHNVLSRYTPYFVGTLYAIFITLETSLSVMSMNPARTFGSAFRGRYWHVLWVYFLAPTLGMLIAAELFLFIRGGIGPSCAKLHHANDKRCIFCGGTQRVDPKKPLPSRQTSSIMKWPKWPCKP